MFFFILLFFLSIFHCENIIEIFSIDELNEYTAKNPIVFLFTLDINSNSYNAYKTASENLNAKFLVCHSKDCLKKFGEDLILLKQYDEKINYYSKFYEEDLNNIIYINIEGFYIKYSVKAGSFLNDISLKLIFEFSKPTIIYFREDDDENKLDNEFQIIVNNYKNNYYFLISNLKGNSFDELKSILNVNEIYGIYLFDKLNEPNFKMFKYKYKSLNLENFKKFLIDSNFKNLTKKKEDDNNNNNNDKNNKINNNLNNNNETNNKKNENKGDL